MEYGWDAENRLISVIPLNPQTGDFKIENKYDYRSRRVEKKVSVYHGNIWELSEIRHFIYEGWNLLTEIIDDGFADTPAPANHYARGLDLSGTLQGAGGIGGLLMGVFGAPASPVAVHYVHDANGNVAGVNYSADNSPAAVYTYDPYGNTVHSSGDLAAMNPFRFSSKYCDVETGLYDYGYRFYKPEMGRWINRDPIGERGGLHLFMFGLNNPPNGYDPLGFWVNDFPNVSCGLPGIPTGPGVSKPGDPYIIDDDDGITICVVGSCPVTGGEIDIGDIITLPLPPAFEHLPPNGPPMQPCFIENRCEIECESCGHKWPETWQDGWIRGHTFSVLDPCHPTGWGKVECRPNPGEEGAAKARCKAGVANRCKDGE